MPNIGVNYEIDAKNLGQIKSPESRSRHLARIMNFPNMLLINYGQMQIEVYKVVNIVDTV
jgi:predicted metallopeptidase